MGAGEIVVMVANPYAEARVAAIDLRGAKSVAFDGRVVVLTSGSPDDENSFETPAKVAPSGETVTITGPRFPHTFPENSLTVLRLRTVE